MIKDLVNQENLKMSNAVSTAKGFVATHKNVIGGKPPVSLILGGKTTQNGTPTPDNKVDIVGAGESGVLSVKSTGKNLLKVVEDLKCWQCTVEITNHGKITLTNTATSGVAYGRVGTIALQKGKTYAISLIDASNLDYVTMFMSGTANRPNIYSDSVNKVFTVAEDIVVDVVVYMKNISTIGNTTSLYIQIEEGNTFSDYEPYTETIANIPLSSPLYGGDYIRYNMDGSGGESHKMKKTVLDGSEIWEMGSYGQPSDTSLVVYGTSGIEGVISNDTSQSWSNQAIWTTTRGVLNSYQFRGAQSIAVTLSKEQFPTVSDWKTHLANNPFIVVHKLAEPTVTPLTETQVRYIELLTAQDGLTNVMSEGMVESGYLANNADGKMVSLLFDELERVENDSDSKITDLESKLENSKWIKDTEGIPLTATELQIVVTDEDEQKFVFHLVDELEGKFCKYVVTPNNATKYVEINVYINTPIIGENEYKVDVEYIVNGTTEDTPEKPQIWYKTNSVAQ